MAARFNALTHHVAVEKIIQQYCADDAHYYDFKMDLPVEDDGFRGYEYSYINGTSILVYRDHVVIHKANGKNYDVAVSL